MFILVYNVFVIVYAETLWPACVYPLTAVCGASIFSPTPHLNVKLPPGGSHLSFGDLNTLSRPQLSETRQRIDTHMQSSVFPDPKFY